MTITFIDSLRRSVTAIMIAGRARTTRAIRACPCWHGDAYGAHSILGARVTRTVAALADAVQDLR